MAVTHQPKRRQKRPTPSPMKRQGWKFDDDAVDRFFRNYLATGQLHTSCKAAGVSEETIRQYELNNYNGFADRFKEVKGLFRDMIEGEIMRRAISGVDEPIIGGKDRDEVVVTVKRYSDKLLELFAKRHIPEYRENHKIDVAVSGGVVVIPGAARSEDQWDAEYASVERQTLEQATKEIAQIPKDVSPGQEVEDAEFEPIVDDD